MIKGTQAQYACFFFSWIRKARGDMSSFSVWHKNRKTNLFLFHLSALKLIMSAFSHFTQQILNWLSNDTDSKTSSSNTMPRKSNRQNPAFFFFFLCFTMSSSDSLGDVFRVGSTPFRKPARKDGKYTWIMFERLTGCLQPLIQYCLCHLTVFPCRWKAKKKRARRNTVAFRSPWKFGIQVVRQDRKMKSFFPFFSSWQCQQRTTWFLTVSVRGSNVKPCPSYTMSLQLASCDQKD